MVRSSSEAADKGADSCALSLCNRSSASRPSTYSFAMQGTACCAPRCSTSNRVCPFQINLQKIAMKRLLALVRAVPRTRANCWVHPRAAAANALLIASVPLHHSNNHAQTLGGSAVHLCACTVQRKSRHCPRHSWKSECRHTSIPFGLAEPTATALPPKARRCQVCWKADYGGLKRLACKSLP